MKALVTGGLGFIGSKVVDQFITNGYEVHVVDNLFTGSIERLREFSAAVKFHEVDIRDEDRMKKTIDEVHPDMVAHLAAIHYIPYCNVNPLECYDVNVRGTNAVLSALEHSSVKNVFITSSAAIYAPAETPHKEDEPGWPVDIYGFTKRTNELAALEWAKRTGRSVVIGRYFNVFGQGETSPHIIPTLIDQMSNGQRRFVVGNISSRRDYIHVTDIARLTYELLAKDFSEPIIVNLGTGLSFSVQDIMDEISRICQNSIEIEQDPKRFRKQDRPNLVADLSMLKKLELTLPRISLAEGLQDLVEKGNGPYLSNKLANFLGDR